MFEIRELSGMGYRSLQMEHDVAMPMHKVLRKISKWLKENDKHGYIEYVHTAGHPDNEALDITTLIYAPDLRHLINVK